MMQVATTNGLDADNKALIQERIKLAKEESSEMQSDMAQQVEDAPVVQAQPIAETQPSEAQQESMQQPGL